MFETRLRLNILYSISSKLISFPLSFFSFILLARYLGETALGEYNFAFSLTVIFKILIDLGFSGLLPREISINKEHTMEILKKVTLIKCITSFIFLILFYFFLLSLDLNKDLFLISYFFSIYTITFSLSSTTDAILHGLEKIKSYSIISVLSRIVEFILVLVFICSTKSLYFICLSMCIGNILRFFLSYIVIKRSEAFKVSLTKQPSLSNKQLVSGALPFLIGMGLLDFYNKIDVIMLSKIMNVAEVGFYSASYRIIELPLIIPGVIMSVLYPAFSKLYVDGDLFGFIKKNELIIKFLVVVGFFALNVLFFFNEKIILMLYGEKYMPSINILKVLSPYLLLSFLNIAYGYIFKAIGKEKIWMIVSIGSLILNIILNWVFIHRFGTIGAAYSTIIAEFVVITLYIYLLRKTIKFNKIAVVIVLNSLLFVVSLLLEQYYGNKYLCLLVISYYFILIVLKNPIYRINFNRILNLIRNRRDSI
ncbi:flippase [Paenibacillus radicis (ex Xue et al. 2023)]|uniref:Flippase n=1 Tax=Paenibacillus radicis (ex Xue et al. 2023) TaxID=2972489 RepID=A0ABT1YGU5_9BACL|nr:flippase [Paenibacillus radicis (ex Xue et al. 2023)]MCR8632407.1 flippase [Paenibacillus radicis (ex Xue et al. 2023)]